jgi:hypothetical protein
MWNIELHEMNHDDEMMVNVLMKHWNDYFHLELNVLRGYLFHVDHHVHVENDEVVLYLPVVAIKQKT